MIGLNSSILKLFDIMCVAFDNVVNDLEEEFLIPFENEQIVVIKPNSWNLRAITL